MFNSSYFSPILNIKDNSFTFSYKEFDPLEFAENGITSNLTAVLAYYAYMIIGYDMDSFSRLGGTPYFQAAENIVTQAQSSDWAGWKAFESDKNRYALINNIMDEAFKKYREYFYEYHRLGLDDGDLARVVLRNARGIAHLRRRPGRDDDGRGVGGEPSSPPPVVRRPSATRATPA